MYKPDNNVNNIGSSTNHTNSMDFNTSAPGNYTKEFYQLVIIGLPIIYSNETIAEKLENKLPDLISVRRILSYPNRRPSLNVSIRVSTKTTYNDLLKSGCRLDNFVYKIERPKWIHQQLHRCYRCQKIDRHFARDCENPVACMKCSGPHWSRDCPNTDEIHCINCNGKHQTNSSDCPSWDEQTKILRYQNTPASKHDIQMILSEMKTQNQVLVELKQELHLLKQEKVHMNQLFPQTEDTRNESIHEHSLLTNERTVLLSLSESQSESDDELIINSNTSIPHESDDKSSDTDDDDLFLDTRDLSDIEEQENEQNSIKADIIIKQLVVEQSDTEKLTCEVEEKSANSSEEAILNLNNEWLIGETNYCSDTEHDDPQSEPCCMTRIYKQYPKLNWQPCKTPSPGYSQVYKFEEFIHDTERKNFQKIHCCDYHHHANLVLSIKQWRRDKLIPKRNIRKTLAHT